MTDAPHKKKKKKKGKGGKVQQQQPERESDSAIGSGENNNDTEMENSEATPQQKRGRQQELNTPHKNSGNRADRQNYRTRRDDNELPELQEFTLMSLNIRGFNSEEKQRTIG